MTVQAPWKDRLENPGPDGHFVQLYEEGDRFYTEAISVFSGAGLKKDEAIILVATAPHWRAISRRMSQKGFDLFALRRKGQVIFLNADETLPKFMGRSMPDAKAFKGIAKATIEKAKRGGRYPRVRWWGEMVNVLYADGNPRASTRLEELFDEVAHEESIAIFCSFCMDKFDPKIYGGDLQNVCRTHAGLMPAEDYDHHRACVDRAVLEVFGTVDDRLVTSLAAARDWTIGDMPPAQALLLFLQKTNPEIAKRVLGLARRHDKRTRGGAR